MIMKRKAGFLHHLRNWYLKTSIKFRSVCVYVCGNCRKHVEKQVDLRRLHFRSLAYPYRAKSKNLMSFTNSFLTFLYLLSGLTVIGFQFLRFYNIGPITEKQLTSANSSYHMTN